MERRSVALVRLGTREGIMERVVEESAVGTNAVEAMLIELGLKSLRTTRYVQLFSSKSRRNTETCALQSTIRTILHL